MSEVFSILGVATSGMGVYKTWLNAVADNVANMNNVVRTDEAAFQERFVEVEPIVGEDSLGEGAMVSGVQFGDPNGIVAYEPNHPLADEEGMIRRPNVSLTDQMVYMQLAQRGYQANVRSFESAKEAYETILSIGK
ncbi:MAG: flagellar basal-body rod protein FlgC [Actinobacteria bacterium]|jgi:flagellar basal-body rod protein FlgC|nr:flagellar basal-body rod protein FlgC [Actinomycetota bacterium]